MGNVKFNSLTIISEPYTIKEGYTSRKAVDCQCDCGEIMNNVRMSRLKNGSVKQCPNCSYKIRSENGKQVDVYTQLFNRFIVHRSNIKNIEISITVEDFKKIVSKNCYYCNIEPVINTTYSKIRKYINTEPVYIHGIDRIDSNKGYHLDNCVSCCTTCNYMKHTLSIDNFKKQILKICKNLKL